jgi:ABC-2 type transport system permease protein
MSLTGSISTRRLKAIIEREFNEIIRDPLYLTLAILVPPVVMMIFGFGLALDIEHVPLGILDQDNTELSRAYADCFTQSETFETAHRYRDMEVLDEDLRLSRLRAGLVIPEGFERTVRRGGQAAVQLQVDGTIPVRAQIVRSYAEAVHQHFLEQVLMQGRPAPPSARVEILSKVWFNQDLRSANFVVPGLVATMLMFYPALLTTLSIVREKESGSIHALYCSPITKTELLLGKLLPYLGISLVNFVAMFALTLYLFAVPLGGSLLLIVVATGVYVFSTCSIGMLISVLVNRQVTAILTAVLVTLLPSFLYSGFFIPLSASSWSTWLIGRIIPATYYLDVLRGVLLKSTGWRFHWPAILTLLIYSLVIYFVSFKCFRKKLG